MPPTVAEALAARLAELEGIVADQAELLDKIDERTTRSQALLIRALAKALGVTDKTEHGGPAGCLTTRRASITHP